jgi:N-acylneuraminate cytidylyltransferase
MPSERIQGGGGGHQYDRSCIAVIPARGGSKRIPKKNIRPLAGKPLLAYTVLAAKDSGLFDRVIVTTDDPSTAEIAVDLGAEVPFLRDPALSDDVVPVSAATIDVLERLDPDGAAFALVCQLMPNCPLRTVDDIIASHHQITQTGAMSQLSVVRYGWQNPWWAMQRDDDFVLSPVFADRITQRSQDLPAVYCPTGAVWWARTEALRREGTFHMAGGTGWEIPWMRGIDIDTQDDWDMVEVIMRMTGRSPETHV